MPITIQCPSCRHEYKVDDKLVGKKVKCRDCGESIPVNDPNEIPVEPDVFALDDGHDAVPTGSGGSRHGSPPPGPSVRRCPSCRTPNPPSAINCTACGYNLRPEPAVSVETLPISEPKVKKKKSRFLREPGKPIFNSIDGFLNLIIWWGSIAAVAVWVVHIARSPNGLVIGNLLPIGVILFIGALVLAPLATIAIKTTGNYMKFPPRHDTYNRVMLSLLLPFSASLLTGWPGNASPIFGQIATLAWIAFPALFIYLFRAEVVECVATVLAGGVAVAIGWVVAGLAASAITSATGPLYADMLPEGPWQSFTKGISPPPATQPAAPTPAKPAVAAASTTTAPTTEPTASVFFTAPANGGIDTSPNAQHSTATVTHAPDGRPGAHVNPLAPDATTATPDATPQPTFFADIGVEDPNLSGVRDLLPVAPPAPWMLLIKGGDAGGSVTAERWSVQPVAHKGNLPFSELPKEPNSYALSPKGDTLVAVVRFPRNQIQLSTFDNKPPRTIPLAENSGAIPTLAGFINPAQYAVRWDLGGNTKLQIFSTTSLSPIRTVTLEMREGPNEVLAISPNGRFLATVGYAQGGQMIIVYNLETGMVAKRISPTTSPFKSLGLAFSPDSSQIALYATISDVSTILAFKAQSGQPGFNGMLEAPAIAPDAGARAARPPSLLWLQNNLAWLVNGNDLYDTTTGKKLGTLNLPDLVDARLIGTDSLAIVQTTPDASRKVTVARFDDAALKGTPKPAAASPPQ